MTTCKHADSGCNYPEGECLGVCMGKQHALENEACPNCGAAVHVAYGPDIRFDQPGTLPLAYRAECSGDCLAPSWTAFTHWQALELWNSGVRRIATAKATSQEGGSHG